MTKLNYQTNFSLHAGVPATRNERRRGQLSFIVQVSVAGRGTLAGGAGVLPGIWNGNVPHGSQSPDPISLTKIYDFPCVVCSLSQSMSLVNVKITR